MQMWLHRGVRWAKGFRRPRGARQARLACAAALATIATAASAEERYDLSPVALTPAGDRFFVAPGASVNGHRHFAAKLGADYAYAPLLVRVEPNGREHDLVGSRLTLNAGASFALLHRLLLFADLPLVVHQGGASEPRPESPALGDARLGARVKLASAGPVDLASELRVWLPTGSGDALSGDGTPRASVGGIVSGKASVFSFAASLGFLARERSDLAGAELGPAFPFAVAVAVHPTSRLQVGPELWGAPIAGGRTGFFSDRETPLFALLGIRFRAGNWVIGGGAGPGLTEAPGVSPRLVLNVAYEPEAPRARRRRDEPAAAPPEREAGRLSPPAPQPVDEAYPVASKPPAPAPQPEPPKAPPRSEAAIRAEAREAFSRGVAAYDEARYTDAAAEFARAYELLPHISVLRNLAHSELMSGDLSDSCAHFVKWRAEVKNPTPNDLKQAAEGMARACR